MFNEIPERNLASWNLLIGGFSDRGELDAVKHSLEIIPQRDFISWNSLVAVYVQAHQLDQAKAAFDELPQRDWSSWNLLVSGYAQTGKLQTAAQWFGRMPQWNVVSWNALIAGHAKHGVESIALNLLSSMSLEGVIPDSTTFSSVLAVYSHKGMLAACREIFGLMVRDHWIDPSLQQFCGVVDALGRSGKLSEAEELASAMPYLPNRAVCNALLGACNIHSDVTRGGRMASCAVDVAPSSGTSYVLLSNMSS
ncbi:hypothetical protein SELMODRAFT_136285 [Selaginella moellendorffii]|uniref:Pentacotripeptide-repeat region of PRORP domain-containing protein n=1 Tax=Selaginella moellendorffii TaxID=88036 RepID=D8TBQ3_SELML|nr:hypothetical protein SELMODRAFT_136285 [Selaginella moellendorffii]